MGERIPSKGIKNYSLDQNDGLLGNGPHGSLGANLCLSSKVNPSSSRIRLLLHQSPIPKTLGVILSEPREVQVVGKLQLSLRGHIQCAGSKSRT